MFTESLQRLSFRADGAVLCRVLQRALDDYIRNICDLSYMIQSFKKPLIIYANGVTSEYVIPENKGVNVKCRRIRCMHGIDCQCRRVLQTLTHEMEQPG